ncbi:MAG: hypothetical protein WD009_04290 [Phycisphaeraceae bacterium]
MPLTITINAGRYARLDAVAELTVPEPVVGLTELDENDQPLASPVACQCEPDPDDASRHRLSFLVAGHTPAGATRRYRAVDQPSVIGDRPTPLVTLDDDVPHAGHASIRITTPGATWLYHKAGGGFASLFDAEGRDWISYHPGNGPAGEYRGIPNLVHPEGYFHPGGTACATTLLAPGPLRATFASQSSDGQWACRWDVYPAHARLTVVKAPRPWWFLYEGTPAGELDEQRQRVTRSTGEQTPASERWTTALPHPAWVAFSDPTAHHSLYAARHPHQPRPTARDVMPDQVTDSYWPMQSAMTVFGFGRDRLDKFHTHTPATFSVGLLDATDAPRIAAAALACIDPVDVRIT